MERRKVLFTEGMSNDMMLIITDAPKEKIKKWCYDYNKGLENGENKLFDKLKKEHYFRILHDSELENNNDDVEIIGYDEVYELSDYFNNDSSIKMTVNDWFETADYKKAKTVNFFSNGGRELEDKEIYEKEIVSITRNNGFYDVEIEAEIEIEVETEAEALI